MQKYYEVPFLRCGKICKVNLPDELSKNDRPINLARVKVNIRNIQKPCVLINYSQNLEFKFAGSNPVLSIVYRLIRKSNHTGNVIILDEWNYRVSEIIPTIVQEVNTIEPLVLNFCDCLGNVCDESFTYIMQISEIITENTTFNITNQEMSGIVSCGERE